MVRTMSRSRRAFAVARHRWLPLLILAVAVTADQRDRSHVNAENATAEEALSLRSTMAAAQSLIPKTFLPKADAVHGDERQHRLLFWSAVMSLTIATTVGLGTLILTVGVQRRKGRYAHLAQGAPTEVTAAALRLQTATVFMLYFSMVLGVVGWSVHSSRISARTGLDFELYFILLLCGCLWLLTQAVHRGFSVNVSGNTGLVCKIKERVRNQGTSRIILTIHRESSGIS